MIQSFDIPKTKEVVRLDTIISVTSERDAWFMLIAYGDKATPPILAIHKKPIIPKGFTNPIWVDVDGDGTIQSVHDFSLEQVKNRDSKSIGSLLTTNPETIPYVFKSLFENQHPSVLDITSNFLATASVEQKLMLYRELSKLGTSEAITILKQEKQKVLIPLEEITLAWYLHFPLSKSKIENFKEKQKEVLDEHLSWLEREFLYLHTGAVQRHLKQWKESSQKWEEAKLSRDGILHVDNNQADLKDEKVLFEKSIFALKEAALTVWLQTNALSLEIWNNGKKVRTIQSNIQAPTDEKLIEIPLEKRWNDIQLMLSPQEETTISFIPFSNELLLDKPEGIREIEHLAINKTINYVTEYNAKYHGFGTALTDGLRRTTNYKSQL